MSFGWCFLNLPLRLPLYKKRPTKVVQSRRCNPNKPWASVEVLLFSPFLNQCNCPLFLFMSRTSGTFVPLCRFVPFALAVLRKPLLCIYQVPTIIRYKVLPLPPLTFNAGGCWSQNPMMRPRKPPSQASSRETRLFLKNSKKSKGWFKNLSLLGALG